MGTYYKNPDYYTFIGGVKKTETATTKAQERNENPLRRMTFGVGHNGQGIEYLVKIQCFDEFNNSLARIKMHGFIPNIRTTELLVGPNE